MQPVLEFVAVARTFPGPTPVAALRPTDLRIFAGDLVTVSGPSGSGKSTLLSLAGLLDRPTEGRVVVDSIDTTELVEAERTALRGAWIGFVFQSFHLLPLRTVLDNVCLAGLYGGVSPQQNAAQARAALDRVGLSHRVDAYANTLSGGEKQRVAIARAVSHRPRLLLCDEPTGNLDSKTSAAVVDLLLELNASGIATVIITHDEEVAALGRRRFGVRDGEVTEDE